jgi:AcrR family transcriptional regulator
VAYTRLDVDERRRRLLEAGAQLFTRHAYDELSMARIAREAGISKALLYHYFPSKRDFFVATLQEKAGELSARVTAAAAGAPDAAPAEQLRGGFEAFLGWVEENATAYVKLIRSAGIPEVGELVEQVRETTARRIADGLGGEVGAVRAWLWFVDGAILGWLERGDLSREQVRDTALGALAGALGRRL